MQRFTSRARALRVNQTSAEQILWRALRNRQLGRWKFRRQHSIGGYITDFATLDGKLVIEVDGATHGSNVEQASDAERTREIERCGFRVVRVTNADIRDNLDGVLETILHELRAL
jgi:very-short-patch-repair endonuclease